MTGALVLGVIVGLAWGLYGPGVGIVLGILALGTLARAAIRRAT